MVEIGGVGLRNHRMSMNRRRSSPVPAIRSWSDGEIITSGNAPVWESEGVHIPSLAFERFALAPGIKR